MPDIHTNLPLPNKPLGQHCSALVNETLYTFSETSFQSLQLKEGGKWEELPLLFGTRGAACVHAHQDTPEEALYITGGTSPNATMVPEKGYTGMQKYTFRTRKWEVIATADPIAYNMTNHGAVYLKDSQEILMFSGTRWPDEWTPSAMTFLIKTVAPYVITAVPGETIPPLLAPVVLPWESNGALIVGGSAQNTNLLTYNPEGGWKDLGVQLKEGIPVHEAGATLVDGDDGSKMLLTFDMSTSPVKFARTKVKDPTAPPPSTTDGSFGGTKGLTETNWPTYNGTYAPQKVETSFAWSSGGGLLVLSGGNDEAPLCVFDSRQNQWEDPTTIFSPQDILNGVDGGSGDDGLRELPGPTSTDSPESTSTESSEPATHGKKLNNIQLLFIILGVCLGALLILGAALFYIRRRRKGGKTTRLGRSNTTQSKMSFQDRGLSFMKETGPIDDLPRGQRGSGWSKYFSGGSATNLVNLPSRTYSTRGSSVYDTNNSAARYPYQNGPADPARPGPREGRAPASVRSAGLELDLPGSTLNVNPQHFSASRTSRRVSNGTVSSLGASSYSSGIPESILEKSAWDPTGYPGGGSGGMVGSTDRRYGEVQNSPRGWAVITDNRIASSVYPESAVTVDPDDYGQPSSSSRVNVRNENGIQNDVSWLNLRV